MAITKGTFTAYAGADGSAISVTSSSFDSTGAGLLVSGVIFEGADTTVTFSDNKGNTWQTANRQLAVNQFSVRATLCWCVPGTVGTGHTVTATFGANRTFRRICVLNVNGSFNASDALDVTAAGDDGNGTAVDAGSLVTTAAAILVQAVGDNAGLTFTAGTGWTKDSATTSRHFQSRVEASSGTFDPVGTLSGAYDWSSPAMAFKETAGGGGDQAASAGSGSVVITGSAPTAAATAHVWEDAGSGSIVIDGQTPTLSVTEDQFVSAAVASLVIDGQVPGVAADMSIAVSVASLVIDGQTPTLTADQAVSAASAALTITGQTPTLFIDSFRIDVPAASQYVTLKWDAVAGATGYDIGYDTDSGDPYANVVDVGLVNEYTVGPLAGTYFFNVRAYDGGGDGPWNDELVWTSSGILIDGQVPTVTISTDVVIATSAASLVINNQLASIPGDLLVLADVASLTIDNQAPELTASDYQVVSVDPASLVINGQTPAATGADLVIAVSAADLIINGSEPEISVSEFRRKGAGKPSKDRKRRRWELPNGMHVFATEAEVVELVQQLTDRPVIVQQDRKQPIPRIRLDDGALAQPEVIRPVDRRKLPQAEDMTVAGTQIAHPGSISLESVMAMLNLEQRRRRRKAAILLLS